MGRQMQLDFGEYRMKCGQKYYILAAILSLFGVVILGLFINAYGIKLKSDRDSIQSPQ